MARVYSHQFVDVKPGKATAPFSSTLLVFFFFSCCSSFLSCRLLVFVDLYIFAKGSRFAQFVQTFFFEGHECR